jgi:bifunctional N-acetylglucosamine-1-phosphate-uridyltransferase/glucosamine-1-phosphate-acetyltransferase GlmU-like protein
MLATIIMAGGLGKRMNSTLPKVLHTVGNFPMIYYVLRRAFEMNSSKVLIVVGKYKDLIKKTIQNLFNEDEFAKIHFIIQPEFIVNGVEKVGGTGHAILCCLPFLQLHPKITNVLILSGDVPLLQLESLQSLTAAENSMLIIDSSNPTGCGRIIFDGNHVLKIIEEKDCSPDEREISHINCGIYYLQSNVLLQCIPEIKNENAANEYYLTDLIEISRKKNIKISYHELSKRNIFEILNINTEEELICANNINDVCSFLQD